MLAPPPAGGIFVPVNPLLKPDQVAYILADCNVAILVTSRERLAQLGTALAACPDLRTIVVTGRASRTKRRAARRCWPGRPCWLPAPARPSRRMR